MAQRHMVEIVKALSLDARIVIMDEPTSALSLKEVEDLYKIVRRLRSEGRAIVFISHKFEDIYEIACAVAGGEVALRESPFLLLYAEPISPLLFNEESVDKLLFCAEKGIPVAYVPSPNTGGGAPITLAGAIAMAIHAAGALLVAEQRVVAPQQLLQRVAQPVTLCVVEIGHACHRALGQEHGLEGPHSPEGDKRYPLVVVLHHQEPAFEVAAVRSDHFSAGPPAPSPSPNCVRRGPVAPWPPSAWPGGWPSRREGERAGLPDA